MAQAPLFKRTKGYGKVPGFLRKSEVEYFRRVKKTYNQRIDRAVKEWQRFDERATYESLVRQGLVPPKFAKALGDYTSRKQIFRAIKAMEETGTAEWKEGQTDSMRGRMKNVIDMAYAPDPEIMDVINKVIDRMSKQDIVKFSNNNPQIVADYYAKYKEHMEGGVVDADAYLQNVDDLLAALGPFVPEDLMEEYLEATSKIAYNLQMYQ